MNISTQVKSITKEALMHYFAPEICSLACKKCPKFGKLWCCPPFDFDLSENPFWEKAQSVTLVHRRAKLSELDLQKNSAEEIFAELRKDFDRHILDFEKNDHKTVAMFAGSCVNCRLLPDCCPRKDNLPCPFPENLRPSLEACGFDVAKLLSEHFDTKLQWSQKPDALSLLAAAVHF